MLVIEDDGQPAQKKAKVSSDDEASPLYYLTKVRGIPDHYNQQSIGIKGALLPHLLVSSTFLSFS